MKRSQEIFEMIFNYAGEEYIPGVGRVAVSPAHAQDNPSVREIVNRYLPEEGEYFDSDDFEENFDFEEDF